MVRTLTLHGPLATRILSFLSGIGMMVSSILTIRHYFQANFPESIFEGSFCDISAFFNCDASAFSEISAVMNIPIGYFGMFAGALVVLGVLFPSGRFERTNAFIALGNLVGVISLFLYTVLVLGSLCLLCSGYYIFSILSFFLFWRWGAGRNIFERFFRPSIKMLVVFATIAAMGGYGMIAYHGAREAAKIGTTMKIVKEFYELPIVGEPSFVSPFRTASAAEVWEDAPIRLIEFSDFLCPDCLFLTQQLDRLKQEFAGRLSVAFQFFPLEGECNDVVPKDLHGGACELAYIAAYDPGLFLTIHDELFANFNAARDPEWRRELAIRYGVEAALEDPATREMVRTIMQTGVEYEQTDERYTHGIRSTPTMIINGRMVIGTLPYEHMRAIFQALVDEAEGGRQFLENWVPPKARKTKR